jgi:hypothetical protein
MNNLEPFEGIIDIHAHADPDRTRRSLDALELARQYRDRGFRGLVLMNHYDATAGQAYLVRKVVPGIEIEFIYYVLGTPGTRWTIEGYAQAIRAIGAERCILSSCGGQAWMPTHPYAWSELIDGLLAHGIAQDEIDTMARVNPARLLGLK